MDIIQYKGFEIRAVPRKLADGGKWQINLNIFKHTEGETKIRNFYAADAYDTKEEAVQNCFQFGRQIIDGQVASCTVSDL